MNFANFDVDDCTLAEWFRFLFASDIPATIFLNGFTRVEQLHDLVMDRYGCINQVVLSRIKDAIETKGKVPNRRDIDKMEIAKVLAILNKVESPKSMSIEKINPPARQADEQLDPPRKNSDARFTGPMWPRDARDLLEESRRDFRNALEERVRDGTIIIASARKVKVCRDILPAKRRKHRISPYS